MTKRDRPVCSRPSTTSSAPIGAPRPSAASGLSPITNKLVIALIAITVGVAGVWALFIAANRVVDILSTKNAERIRPFLFVGPAIGLLGFYLVFPAINTIRASITEDGGAVDNYRFAFTDPDMLIAFRNNVIWLLLGTGGSVVLGLVIAQLVDRVKREALAKTFVFLPLAISMVGAAVVWRFVYVWRPPGQPQIGILNAGLDALGREPVAFFQTIPLNTLALIVIMVWLQTGFAMVILSAAIKGVPSEMLEAGRIDGADDSRSSSGSSSPRSAVRSSRSRPRSSWRSSRCSTSCSSPPAASSKPR